MEKQTEKEIVYIGDPLCSWCYGIAPELDALRAAVGDEIDFRVVMGGLRTNVTDPISEKMKDFLRHHWLEVSERSGQPFNFDLLDTDQPFVYDTEPPCRAVVTVRMINPGAEWAFMKKVQHAFYAQNKDTNEIETYLPLLEGTGVSEAGFRAGFESAEARRQTWADIAWVKDSGIRGFPTVVYHEGDKWHAIGMGYATVEQMTGALARIRK